VTRAIRYGRGSRRLSTAHHTSIQRSVVIRAP
jgi:hypothetical protein